MKKLYSRELSTNQPILRFDVILQHDWLIEQCLLHIRVFFGGKTKKPCFDFFIQWLINQITNTYRIHFSRSYENRSIVKAHARAAQQRRRARELRGSLARFLRGSFHSPMMATCSQRGETFECPSTLNKLSHEFSVLL